MQLNPLQPCPLVYQLNPNDGTTYYVRAVVRYSNSGVIFKTLNLTDQGGQRFTGSFQTPNGNGVVIDITYTVYINSGYTTIAGYGSTNESHVIQILDGIGNSGGDGISEETMRKILGEMLGGIKFPDKSESIYKKLTKHLEQHSDKIQRKLGLSTGLHATTHQYLDSISYNSQKSEISITKLIEEKLDLILQEQEEKLEVLKAEQQALLTGMMNEMTKKVEKTLTQVINNVESVVGDNSNIRDEMRNFVKIHSKTKKRKLESYLEQVGDGLKKFIDEPEDDEPEIPKIDYEARARQLIS